MKVVWLREASVALDIHYDYLASRNPKAARFVFKRIVASTKRLRQFPQSGRQGRFEGTREVVVPGVPYIVVYRASPVAVEILRVFPYVNRLAGADAMKAGNARQRGSAASLRGELQTDDLDTLITVAVRSVTYCRCRRRLCGGHRNHCQLNSVRLRASAGLAPRG